MKKVISFINKFKKYIYSIVFLIFVFLSCLISTNLSDYKMDDTFNAFFSNINCKDTYLSITNKGSENNSFSNLYYSFFWTSLSSNSRRRVDSFTTVDELDKEEVGLFFQDYFTIVKNSYSGDRFYLHDGMFFTYFDNNPVSVNSVRFGCNGFVLISDRFADKLLEKYGIENKGPLSYRKLIDNELFAKISFSFDGGEKITLCINNIIDSSKRVGARVQEEIPFFGLTYYGYVKELPICFEADFKGEGYSPKAFVDTIYNSGFSLDKTNYQLYKKDADGCYKIDKESSNKLTNALESKKNDILYKILLIIICFVCFASVVLPSFLIKYTHEEKKDFRICGIVISVLSFALLFIQQFAKLYYLFSLLPVIYILTWFICLIINLLFRKGGTRESVGFFEVSI